jgi:hypothetical protein
LDEQQFHPATKSAAQYQRQIRDLLVCELDHISELKGILYFNVKQLEFIRGRRAFLMDEWVGFPLEAPL